MKTFAKLFAVALLASGSYMAVAQTEFSEDCITNNSLYTEYAKQKNYADAYEFWVQLYSSCPNFNKNIYIYGEKILQWKIAQTKDPAQHEQFVEALMKLYDDRIKYFGDDAKKPSAAILADKGISYLVYMGDKADTETAFRWLNSAVTELKDKTDAKAIVQWVNLSFKKYKADPAFKAQYIANYMKGTEYINGSLDNYQIRLEAAQAQGDDPKAQKEVKTCNDFISYIKLQKGNMTGQFGNSGAADCQTLIDIFTPQLAEKKDDGVFLSNVTSLLARSKCKDSDLYFQCSEYRYNLSPDMESAKGMSQLALKNQDWDKALYYLEQSFGFAIQPDDKADILLLEATVYWKHKKNFLKARELCRQSLQFNPKQAEPHQYIAEMYAASGAQVFPNEDGIVRATVFMAAVEELQKAKAADPSRAAEINSRIAQFKQQFPEKSQLFMKGIHAGSSFSIPGWMGITITIPN